MIKYITLALFCLPFIANAQNFAFGVRIGLNFNKFLSESELDDNGASLETFDFNSGFMIGATGNLAITDIFGIRAELLYSQKGGKLKFEGEALQIFNGGSADAVLAIGDRKSILRVTNSYLDIPITGYVKLGRKFRLHGGVNMGLLLGSSGFGELTFNGRSAQNSAPIEFTSELDYNFLKDEGYLDSNVNDFDDPFTFTADGKLITVPKKIGAYYLEFPERNDPGYSRLDFGVLGGASYYFSGSLYFSVMANLGLSDSSNNEYDISRTTTDGTTRVLRSDKDAQLSIQTSIGFQF